MNYNLNLSSEHVRLAIAALAELPYKMAAPAIEAIMKQTDAQEAAAASANAPLVPPTPPGADTPAV